MNLHMLPRNRESFAEPFRDVNDSFTICKFYKRDDLTIYRIQIQPFLFCVLVHLGLVTARQH